jgi:hypothetical protein
MKMTIVIDTDDVKGIEDAHQITRLMRDKYAPLYSSTSGMATVSFGKIEFIKMLRKFGGQALDNCENDEEFSLEHIKSLRFTKRFADAVWKDKKSD